MFTRLDIPASLLSPGRNDLKVSTGADTVLYYDLIHRYSIPQKQIGPAGTLSVERRYMDPKTGQPVGEIHAGQLIKVEIRLRSGEEESFLIIEDHLPGGLEAINEGLNTSPRLTWDDYEGRYIDEFSWESLGYNQKEIHSDRVTFFVTGLKRGFKSFTYFARAIVAGSFTALPAEAYAMYEPATWGRSASDQVEILP
jgi:uncharacterized protein YfaS (alpha-2-macroglobulin family)